MKINLWPLLQILGQLTPMTRPSRAPWAMSYAILSRFTSVGVFWGFIDVHCCEKEETTMLTIYNIRTLIQNTEKQNSSEYILGAVTLLTSLTAHRHVGGTPSINKDYGRWADYLIATLKSLNASRPHIDQLLRSTSSTDFSLSLLRATFGERAFSHAGPAAWNSMPEHIRAELNIRLFRKLLRKHFNIAFIVHWHSVLESNLVHFSLIMWHVVAIIVMIFLIINWPYFV